MKNRSLRHTEDEYYETLKPHSFSIVDGKTYTMLMHIKNVLLDEAVVEMHWHEWVEILHVVKGQTKVITEYDTHIINEGQVLVIGSTTPHRLEVAPGEHYTRCFHIHAGLLVEYHCLEHFTGTSFLVENNQPIIEQLDILATNGDGRCIKGQLIHNGTLLMLIASLLNQIESSKSLSYDYESNQTMDSILTYVNKKYSEDLSLSDVAETFGYTKQHISLMFKKYRNTTFMEYLNSIRIRKAKHRLIQSDSTILDVAYDCGFSSEHAFIRNFKKIVGKTPHVYRIDMRRSHSEI